MVVYGLIFAAFILVFVSGAAVVVYGIKLGYKIAYRVKEDLPLNENESPIEQEFT